MLRRKSAIFDASQTSVLVILLLIDQPLLFHTVCNRFEMCLSPVHLMTILITIYSYDKEGRYLTLLIGLYYCPLRLGWNLIENDLISDRYMNYYMHMKVENEQNTIDDIGFMDF